MSDQNQPEPPAEKKPKKAKPPSRAQRWSDAVGNAKDAISMILRGCTDLEAAVEEITGVQEEYEEWKDNMPENLANSPLGEKLEAVCGLDFDFGAIQTAAEDGEGVLDEAESIDLPQGFGRD